jgi:hypothetical protein
MFTLRSFATIAMDTIVSTSAESERPVDKMDAALERAIAWFGVVERACSRFDAQSELTPAWPQRERVGVPVATPRPKPSATRPRLPWPKACTATSRRR